MADLHFFPFYPKDWLAGDATALMTPEQEGAFIRLLAIAWLNDPPCTLPDDDAYLAQRSRLGKRWARAGQLVRAQFQPDGAGRLRNAKLYEVWQVQIAKHERRVQAGSRGGVAKALLKQSSSNATAMPEQCSSIQNQIQNQNQKETLGSSRDEPARTADAYSADFELAWAQYPSRGTASNPKRLAWKAWVARLRSGVTAETLQDGVARYRAFCDASGKTGTEYVMHAATFFGPNGRYAEPWLYVAHGKQGAPDAPRVLPATQLKQWV